MRRPGLWIVCFACLFWGLTGAAHAAKRVALVVGNSDYNSIQRLTNPENDARLIASILRKQGFEVLEHTNLGYKGMKRAVKGFTSRLEALGKDTVGLMFYAGHGIQANGRNYLVPIDADIKKAGDVEIETIDAQDVMSGIRASGNRLNIVILDACRNNPYASFYRSASRGLARLDAPIGSMVAFSTSPGTVAADGTGKNSPYTTALAKVMQEPGLKIESVFKKVRRIVYKATSGEQVPWESSSIFGDFYFSNKTEPAIVTPPVGSNNRELAFWDYAKSSTDPKDLEAYLARFPNGTFVPLARGKLERMKLALITPPKDLGIGAQEAASTCDRAARRKTGANRPGTVFGVSLGQIDTGKAITACRAAVISFPEIARYSYQLGRVYEHGRRWREAQQSYERAAQAGSVPAMMNLASLLTASSPKLQDYSSARRWYNAASNAGNAVASNNLGSLNEKGLGGPRDFAAARTLYKRAADSGVVRAMYNFAVMNHYGIGQKSDVKTAIRYYERGVSAGDQAAMVNLGVVYFSSKGGTANPSKAIRLFEDAEALGNAMASTNLAVALDTGRGLTRNPRRAAEKLIRALEAGEQQALQNLTKRSSAWSSELWRELQNKLRQKGVYRGASDGKYGPATFAAVKRIFKSR